MRDGPSNTRGPAQIREINIYVVATAAAVCIYKEVYCLFPGRMWNDKSEPSPRPQPIKKQETQNYFATSLQPANRPRATENRLQTAGFCGCFYCLYCCLLLLCWFRLVCLVVAGVIRLEGGDVGPRVCTSNVFIMLLSYTNSNNNKYQYSSVSPEADSSTSVPATPTPSSTCSSE